MKRKIINIISIFLIVIILMANFSYGIFTPHIYECEVDGKKLVAYAELNAATITLPSGKRIQNAKINGDTQINSETIEGNIEVILIIDRSTSMKKGSRMGITKDAAIYLVESLLDKVEDIKISVISFSTRAKVEIRNSKDKGSIIEAINDLEPSGATYIANALKYAENIFSSLQSENENSGTKSFLVNLTDGIDAATAEAYSKLLELQEKNVNIYNVLLECDYRQAFTGSEGDAGIIYPNVMTAELVDVYDQIYNDICTKSVSGSVSVSDFTEDAQNYFITNDDLYMFLDNEILQGCKLEMEYIINIKSAISCTKLELQDDVDKNLNFNISSKLISEDITNGDCGWQINEELSYQNGHNLVLSLCELPEENSEYVIEEGGTYQTKLVLSTLLTSQIEDLNYKNLLTFRINEEQDLTHSLEAMEVNIIPPFGEDKSQIIIWILLLVSILILTYIIVFH